VVVFGEIFWDFWATNLVLWVKSLSEVVDT
jgi:hypothetical protein